MNTKNKVNLSSVYGKCVNDASVEPPVVDTYLEKIIVAFDDSDIAGISEFYEFAESASCTFEFEENVFIVKANHDVLYEMIYVLASVYSFIKFMSGGISK